MILIGDCRDSMRRLIADGVRVQMCVTSPPYFGLRDYGVDGQLGLESTPDEYVSKMVEVFRLVRELLADDGTLWLNLGDSYAASGRGGGGGSFQDDDIGKKVTEKNNRRAPVRGSVLPAGMHDSVLSSGGIGRAWQPAPAGFKPKDILGIPWRVAFALQADGWYLRQDIIWHKPNPMPESVRDRCTKSHEYLFLLAKSERYYYDAEAIAEPCKQEEFRPTFRGGAYCNNATFNNAEGGKSTVVGNVKRSGNKARKSAMERDCPRDGVAGSVPWEGSTRNKRSVWTVATRPYSEAHFATYPPALIEPCILAGSKPGDTVLDPFFGSGTTGEVAQRLGRKWIGCELNPEYGELAEKRTSGTLGIVF